MPKGLEDLKMFSLENEKTKDYAFFCFSEAKKKKGRLKGGTPKQKLKTIEVVFMYSKRSTGF